MTTQLPPPPVSVMTPLRVKLVFHDNTDRTYHNVQALSFTDFGCMELFRPREVPNGKVLIPFAPNTNVRLVEISEEPIALAK